MQKWKWLMRVLLLILLLSCLLLYRVLVAQSSTLRWWRVGYKCCSSNICAIQKHHTRVEARQ